MRELATVGLVFVAALASEDARGEPPPWQADLSCQRRASRGRVVCELEVEARAGRLAWADGIVVEAPDFARPLKSRVGPPDARARSDRRIRLPMAFFAERVGTGRVVVRARAVVCRARTEGEVCESVSRRAAAGLVVGPDK